MIKTSRWASTVVALSAVAVLAACAMSPLVAPPKLKDGELPIPANYKSWPRFLPTIDRVDVKQIRDIYINPEGAKATAGGAFPQGTRFVMEIYAAATKADGSAEVDASGRLIKGPLLHVYLMGKEANWGDDVPEATRNGNWIYGAYKPDGSPNSPLLNTCRSCHTPLKDKDFVFHYDRYFAQRKAAWTVDQIHAQAAQTGALVDAHAVARLDLHSALRSAQGR